MKIRVFEAFAGYGSQSLALEQLAREYNDFEIENVGISEIDRYAIQAYNTLHPNVKNYGDISKIDWHEVPDFDLFTYSFPCTDVSNAGEQKGLEEGSGTRSSLLWECRKAIEVKKPKYLLMENVSALVSQKFLPFFNKWLLELDNYGYKSYAKVLNAKDYGVPQNRERVFVVSILDENASFYFPEPFKLDKRLKDVLEEKVDEKYYLKEQTIKSFSEHCERKQTEGCGFKFEPTDGSGIAKTISTLAGNRQTDNFISEPLNDYKGVCRTIKAQYSCNNMRNFIRQDGFGATGVIEHKYNNKRLQNLIDSGKVDNNKIQLLNVYNQNVHEDVSITIKARIDDGNTFIYEPNKDNYDDTQGK